MFFSREYAEELRIIALRRNETYKEFLQRGPLGVHAHLK